MIALWAILLLVAAFLAGSIPFGFIVARAKGVDIRKHGSGNIGATNVGRVLGKKWGMLCFFLDFLKGLIPSLLAGFVIRGDISTPLAGALTPNQATALWLSVAVCCVLGHMFTPWLGFKGGKGVATGFGALVGVYPVFTLAALFAFFVWGLSLKLTRMVGISSVIAALAMAALVVFSHFAPLSVHDTLKGFPLWQPATLIHAIFAVFLALLVTYKHRANIQRTLAGTEPKIGEKKTA